MAKYELSEIELEAVIQVIAERHHTTPQEVRRSMEESVTSVWATTDPEAKARQCDMFGDECPSLRRFVSIMGDEFRT